MPDYKQSSYVPALPPEIVPPPPQPSAEPPLVRDSIDSTGAWFVVTLSISLFTIITIVAMLVDGTAGRAAVAAGVKIFLGAMGLVVFVLSGTLTDIVRGWQREKTERHRIDAYADLGEKHLDWRLAVERNRQAELERDALPADLKRRLGEVERALLEARDGRGDTEGLQPDTYVAPYDNRARGPLAPANQTDTTADEALRWAKKLYRDDTGDPDGEMVWLTGKESSHGKLRCKMLGSARDKTGSDAARLWLLDREIIIAKRIGYCLNLDRYPRRDTLYYVD